jgi:hypothetical protein
VLVVDVLNQNPLNIRFNRILVGDKWNIWVQLVCRLMNVHLSNEPDKFKWRLTITCSFSVQSMYAVIMNAHTVFLFFEPGRVRKDPDSALIRRSVHFTDRTLKIIKLHTGP